MALADVLDALKTSVVGAINAAGITEPGQVGIGWPVATELVNILAQGNFQWQVTLYPLPGARDVTRYLGNDPVIETAPNLGLTVTFSNNVATFSGTLSANANCHGFLKGQNADAYAALTSGMTAAQAASAFASAITGLGLSGISATASGAQVTVTGADFSFINLGGTGTVTQEVGRVMRGVQVSAWTSGPKTSPAAPPLCWAIGDAIIGAIGQRDSMRLAVDDGTTAIIKYRTDTFTDDSESPYSLYVRHIIFDLEYPVIKVQAATQVGAFSVATAADSEPATTSYIGGAP